MNKEPVTPPGDARAVFISYAHADNESSDPQKRWLDQLLEILNPQEDIDICSDRDIEIGEQWHERIQAHLNAAKAVVLLVSPAFLASSYIRNSELPVILKNAAEKNVKIFPIIISPCLYEQTTFKYPDPRKGPEEFTLASIQAANPPSKTHLEMDEGERKRVLVKVAMQVRKIIPIRLQVDPAGDKLALSNIPDHNAFFTDREQVLVQVQDALAKGGRVALSGLDGVGKTQTALEYAQRHSGEYANIFWATADALSPGKKTDNAVRWPANPVSNLASSLFSRIWAKSVGYAIC